MTVDKVQKPLPPDFSGEQLGPLPAETRLVFIDAGVERLRIHYCGPTSGKPRKGIDFLKMWFTVKLTGVVLADKQCNQLNP